MPRASVGTDFRHCSAIGNPARPRPRSIIREKPDDSDSNARAFVTLALPRRRNDSGKGAMRPRTTGYERWTPCHAALLCLLAMGVAALMAEANARDDGLPQIWNPTKDHPLPVSTRIEFTISGQGGINNIMWAVGRAIHSGCKRGRQILRERIPSVHDGSLPLAFAVVILPPLNADFNKSASSAQHQHQYSDLFDLEHQLKLSIKYRNCYITDKLTYRRLKKEGLLYSPGNNMTSISISARGLISAFKGPAQHRVYHGLEMSERLLNLYYNPCVAKMKEAFHPGEPRYAAVHMRVEDDWVPFCQEKEIAFKDSPEYRACFGAAEIAETFMNTPALRENRNVLLLYAADNFTPDLEGRPDSMKPDPMKVWPSDVAVANPILLNCFAKDEHARDESDGPTYTERSIVSMFLAANAEAFMSDQHSTFRKGVNMIRGTSRARPGAAGKSSYIYNVSRNETRVAKPDPFAETVEGFVEGRGGSNLWIRDFVKSTVREANASTPREKLQQQQQQQRKGKRKHGKRNPAIKVSVTNLGRGSSHDGGPPRRAETAEGFVEGSGGSKVWVDDIVKSVMREVHGSSPRDERRQQLQQHHRKSKSNNGKMTNPTSNKVSVTNIGRGSSSSPRRQRRRHHHPHSRQ